MHWISIKSLSAPTKDVIAEKRGWESEELTQLVKIQFGNAGLPIPKIGESKQNLPANHLLESIYENLKSENVEIYALNNQSGLEWRIYNKTQVQFKIFFQQKHHPIQAPKITAKSGNKLPLSIILTGWQFRNAANIANFAEPLNFLLDPNSPFALHNAQLAAHHWHEIIMDGKQGQPYHWKSLPYTYSILTADNPDLPINWTSIDPNIAQHVQLDQALPDESENQNDIQNCIWLVDIQNYSSQEIQEWLTHVAKRYQLLLLSENPLRNSD